VARFGAAFGTKVEVSSMLKSCPADVSAETDGTAAAMEELAVAGSWPSLHSASNLLDTCNPKVAPDVADLFVCRKIGGWSPGIPVGKRLARLVGTARVISGSLLTGIMSGSLGAVCDLRAVGAASDACGCPQLRPALRQVRWPVRPLLR